MMEYTLRMHVRRDDARPIRADDGTMPPRMRQICGRTSRRRFLPRGNDAETEQHDEHGEVDEREERVLLHGPEVVDRPGDRRDVDESVQPRPPFPRRRTQPFVDVMASGSMMSHVVIPMRMYLCLTISCHMSPQAKNQSTPAHMLTVHARIEERT